MRRARARTTHGSRRRCAADPTSRRPHATVRAATWRRRPHRGLCCSRCCAMSRRDDVRRSNSRQVINVVGCGHTRLPSPTARPPPACPGRSDIRARIAGIGRNSRHEARLVELLGPVEMTDRACGRSPSAAATFAMPTNSRKRFSPIVRRSSAAAALLQMPLRSLEVSGFELDLADAQREGPPFRVVAVGALTAGVFERTVEQSASFGRSAGGKPHVREDDGAGELVGQVSCSSKAGDCLRERLQCCRSRHR